MSPEASQRLARWFGSQPDWVREVYYTHGAIHHLIEEGIFINLPSDALWRDIAQMLLTQNSVLTKKVQHLDSIAPRRVRGPDGAEWIYRCPDHLIPVDEMAMTPKPVFPA